LKKPAFLGVPILATAVFLAACHSHLELQYKPEQYAKLRNIELLVEPPTRNYELLANVQGSGGRHTVPETMINVMIDEARRQGADALMPRIFDEDPRDRVGSRPIGTNGLKQFIYNEDGRTIVRGSAIRWLDGGR